MQLSLSAKINKFPLSLSSKTGVREHGHIIEQNLRPNRLEGDLVQLNLIKKWIFRRIEKEEREKIISEFGASAAEVTAISVRKITFRIKQEVNIGGMQLIQSRTAG